MRILILRRPNIPLDKMLKVGARFPRTSGVLRRLPAAADIPVEERRRRPENQTLSPDNRLEERLNQQAEEAINIDSSGRKHGTTDALIDHNQRATELRRPYPGNADASFEACPKERVLSLGRHQRFGY
ncbi:hypothetical protein NLM27_26900 [Bradyrhizobium sp. CCGB12]|uniref:hypothetical protein n=1 Tax=Bradyrhizobium sp. CCGB12 TaxID=2949632 RepID=UPI0020B34311|nr:hypothetical protein [Bradyrhizobium sp. CCGB12]MCP3392379.1 hypothetical protein [Bradyrhizobium sp. CCGB12]